MPASAMDIMAGMGLASREIDSVCSTGLSVDRVEVRPIDLTDRRLWTVEVVYKDAFGDEERYSHQTPLFERQETAKEAAGYVATAVARSRGSRPAVTIKAQEA